MEACADGSSFQFSKPRNIWFQPAGWRSSRIHCYFSTRAAEKCFQSLPPVMEIGTKITCQYVWEKSLCSCVCVCVNKKNITNKNVMCLCVQIKLQLNPWNWIIDLHAHSHVQERKTRSEPIVCGSSVRLSVCLCVSLCCAHSRHMATEAKYSPSNQASQRDHASSSKRRIAPRRCPSFSASYKHGFLSRSSLPLLLLLFFLFTYSLFATLTPISLLFSRCHPSVSVHIFPAGL